MSELFIIVDSTNCHQGVGQSEWDTCVPKSEAFAPATNINYIYIYSLFQLPTSQTIKTFGCV
jgi:hypothetical protein